ncbi:Bsp6I family type II restriction endonuclease [Candidatus Bipolaricaulota bacterium]|nr:Bsp6I family type II restriction endonuclease [Candidatus Bipolaricaulota bacterium]
MKFEKEKIRIPEGTFKVEVQKFEKKDRKFLFSIYTDWLNLSEKLKKINSRSINIPEGLSEGALCLEMGFWRLGNLSISNANTSFDCYDPKNFLRIQVKAASSKEDLSSFGPRSVWDQLYFVDFYRDGKWDGKFDIYLIDNDDIYNQKVNENQTFKDQQKQGRRPRFSIKKKIINKKKLKPLKTGDLSKN